MGEASPGHINTGHRRLNSRRLCGVPAVLSRSPPSSLPGRLATLRNPHLPREKHKQFAFWEAFERTGGLLDLFADTFAWQTQRVH